MRSLNIRVQIMSAHLTHGRTCDTFMIINTRDGQVNRMGYLRLPVDRARAFVERVFGSYGFNTEESARITDVLLAADLNGIESHGVQRLVRYDQEIQWGWVDTHAVPEIMRETPVSAVIDAHDAMGQLASISAMELAIRKAKTSGIGMVQVRNSNHYGIAGYYAEMAMREDLIGVCMTNSEAIMVPTFGSQAMLGTNPVAVAMPSDPIPFLFDAATTVVPRGKLEVYKKRGDSAPEGWMVDKDGMDVDDPQLVLDNIIHRRGGGILPLGGSGEVTGGHKGYGFGMICELFTAILSGGTTSDGIYQTPGHANISHGFMALDYGLFGDKLKIKADLSEFLQKLRDAKKAEGQDRIYTHGEKEFFSRQEKLAQGIPVNQATLKEMRAIGERQGVDAGMLEA